ncbi:MAG: hypothetical protein NVS3B2_09760 [Ramlibacter sp.]
MQLIKKMFGRGPGNGLGPESAQFHESEPTTESDRSAPRRELVHVVLRDSMRRHGIPSDWIECRILPVVTRSKKSGLHVQLIVRDGIDRLLTYVPAFQASFMEEIARFDPRADDWLLSLSWQFQNLAGPAANAMPDPASWQASAASPLAGGSGAATAATAAPAVPRRTSSATQPRRTDGSTGPVPPPQPSADDELRDDLQALYAIRDAALREGRHRSVGPSGEADFESTHPGGVPQPGPRRW